MKREENQEFSLLETNSTKMSEEELKQPRKKIPWKSVLAVLLAFVIVVGVFVGGGLISEAQYQAQLKKEAARQLREGSEARAVEAPKMVDGELHSGITTLYYTQENGMSVIYEDNVMKLSDRSALAGSASVLSDCVRNMYKTVGAPLYSAVRMASLTPAEVLGFQNQKGKIEKGYDADLIIFDDEINIKSVITNGNVII
jgi:alpha-D-ribose 1-methylphosphonate 5-triphosphate diphosphatase PhnM